MYMFINIYIYRYLFDDDDGGQVYLGVITGVELGQSRQVPHV